MNPSETPPSKRSLRRVIELAQSVQASDARSIKRIIQGGGDHTFVEGWALARTGRFPKADQLSGALQHLVRGWKLLKTRPPEEAFACFAAAYGEEDEVDPAWLGLGLARVYTRVGYWRLARDWALHSFELAQASHDGAVASRCLGALAEILLRSGYPREAWECFDLAGRMLPPGVNCLPRDFGYQASALARTGNDQRARQLLMSAIHLTPSSARTAEVPFYLARLLFLSSDSVADNLTCSLVLEFEHAEGGAMGFVAMGRAHLAFKNQDHRATVEHLENACSSFGLHQPWERYWCCRILFLLDAAKQPDPPETELERILPGDDALSLVCGHWRELAIQENGFGQLSELNDVGALFGCWKLFFI